jgi:hypothetical protein
MLSDAQPSSMPHRFMSPSSSSPRSAPSIGVGMGCRLVFGSSWRRWEEGIPPLTLGSVVVLPHPIGPGMQQHRYTANREGLGIPPT